MKVTCPSCNHRQRIRRDVEQMPWCGDCCVQMESELTKAIRLVEQDLADLAYTHAIATPQTQTTGETL